jgi:hypothetical protein
LPDLDLPAKSDTAILIINTTTGTKKTSDHHQQTKSNGRPGSVLVKGYPGPDKKEAKQPAKNSMEPNSTHGITKLPQKGHNIGDNYHRIKVIVPLINCSLPSLNTILTM